jgi:hypothetical protein
MLPWYSLGKINTKYRKYCKEEKSDARATFEEKEEED